jgi:hypothetical protein
MAFCLAALCHCNNYGLLEKLENPGGSDETCGSDCRIFVTAIGYSGNLGGVGGADQKCKSDPANPAPSRTWKAIISSSTERRACTSADCGVSGQLENLDWALKPNTVYRRADGASIGQTNGAGIFTFGIGLTVPIQPNPAVFVWTGIAGSWQLGSNCTNWTEGLNGSFLGAVADSSSTSAQAIFWSNSPCNGTAFLYCAEQ